MNKSEIMNAVKKTYHIFTRVNFALHAARMVREKSYFSEKKRKGGVSRLLENCEWALKYNELNEFYNLYGFDTETVDQTNYSDYASFYYSRNAANCLGNPSSQIAVLRDKYLFYLFMSRLNLPVPKVFGVILHGKLFDEHLEPMNSISLHDRKDYFIKSLDGECASFVRNVFDYDSFKQLLDSGVLNKDRFILQEKVTQANAMAAINPEAVNTYRIVTINKGDGSPYYFSGVLRVGTKATGNVDNWAAGGLSIGINCKTGYLKKYGFFKPAYGTKVDTHPDTGIRFSEFKAPMLEEAIRIAIDAHRHLFSIHSIGWDIAITPKGPVFIEGNDNWEISLMQACNGGLKKEWEEALSR